MDEHGRFPQGQLRRRRLRPAMGPPQRPLRRRRHRHGAADRRCCSEEMGIGPQISLDLWIFMVTIGDLDIYGDF